MIDIRLIREKADWVKERLASRAPGTEAPVDEIAALDARRRTVIAEVEAQKSERNRISKEVGGRKARGESAEDLLAGMKEKSDRIAALDAELAGLEAAQNEILLRLPNLPHPACPVGADASANPVVHSHGQKPEWSFKPKELVEIAEARGLADFERAAKISGSGYYVLRGAGARLQRSLIQFMLDLHTREHGYTEIAPPVLVREACMVGTNQLPKFREDMYHLEGEDLFLAPTAEVPVTNLHREELLKAEELPISYAAHTPCFRREAGKESRGMLRVHQFDKIELVKIVRPEDSYAELEKLRGHAQRVLELLGLHYRAIELCTGDIGFGAAKCYDLEVWAPGAGAYLEVSSCSNFEDFQARRMGLRFKDGDGKNRLCHTLNGSGVALPRLFIALVETHQQADGSVRIPEALRPYYGAEFV
ncbi:MAG: serine--tRNA ligase [Candidatus Methylacidiphilales bacterium]|nr:serine--tRNA ligase [Candidatus Methylacidiphilales bacterium]